MSKFLRMGLMIVAINCFVGFAWIGPRTELLHAIEAGSSVEMDWVSPITIPLASTERIVFYIYLACLPGLLIGMRFARVIFLGILFLMMLESIVRQGVWIFVEFHQLLSQLKAYPLEIIWGMTSGILWIFWFAFNYWFFVLKMHGSRLLSFPICK